MRSLYSVLCILVLLVVGGCAGKDKPPTRVVMQNPETAEFVNCDRKDIGPEKTYKNSEECIKHYEKEGYIVWGKLR